MSVVDLLTDLQARGVQLIKAGDRLRVKAPANLLSNYDRSAISEHKAELLTLLAAPRAHDDWKADCAEIFAAARKEVERRLDTSLCPNCGEPLDSQQRQPRLDWCSACMAFWNDRDYSELREYLKRHSQG